MKCLVYQYYNGRSLPGTKASRDNISTYCKTIGVDYQFDSENAQWIKARWPALKQKAAYFGCMKPVLEYDDYDYILYVDTDVFAVDCLKENIFDQFIQSGCDIAMANELGQPETRMNNVKKNDGPGRESRFNRLVNELGGTLPKQANGFNLVLNSGVVLWSRNGMQIAREKFITPMQYHQLAAKYRLNNVYLTDQNYLHAMVFANKMNFFELPHQWNTILNFHPADKQKVNDLRTGDTKFVHIQFAGNDHFDAKLHYKQTNLPVEQWGANWVRYSS